MHDHNSLAWGLRLANDDDEDFLQRLHAETDVSLQLLPAEWRQALAEMQYRARRSSYSRDLPRAQNWIIYLEDGTLVGRHLVQHTTDDVRGIDLAILPAWQSKGIGTAVLQTLALESARSCIAFRLRVLKGNQAFRLYQRLGFIVEREDELAYELIWQPTKASPRPFSLLPKSDVTPWPPGQICRKVPAHCRHS